MEVAPLTQGQAKATGGGTEPWEPLPEWALDALPTSGGPQEQNKASPPAPFPSGSNLRCHTQL